MDRGLRLRKDTLTELSTDELDFVVGGVPPQPTPPIYVLTHECPTGLTLRCC